MRESGGLQLWLRSWRSAAAGSGRRPRPTGPASARRRSSRSATRPSPARRGGGRGTRTAPARASTRSARPRTTQRRRRRGDPGLPPVQGGRGAHRRRRPEREPRVLGRAHVHERRRQRLQARHRLLLGRLRPQGPGARAAAVRRDAQRARRFAADRRQQLRLRRHRADVRGQLADLAVVVAELLLRRLEHQVALHRRSRGGGDREHRGAILNVRQAMANAGYADSQYKIIAQTYSSPIPRGSGLPLPAVRLDAPDDRRLRRLEPRRRLGQRHGRADVQQHDPQRRGAERAHERARPRHGERAGRAAAVREHASGCSRSAASPTGSPPAPSTRPSGSPRSAR